MKDFAKTILEILAVFAASFGVLLVSDLLPVEIDAYLPSFSFHQLSVNDSDPTLTAEAFVQDTDDASLTVFTEAERESLAADFQDPSGRKPERLVIQKIGVDREIINTETRDLAVLDADLKKGIVNLKTPKIPKNIPDVLNKEEVRSLIDNAGSKKTRLIIKFLYSTGLRVSELVHLKLNNLNLKTGESWVRSGKGNKDRLVKLGENVIRHLMDYKESRYNKGSDYVFDSMARPHTHITKKTVQKILETVRIEFVWNINCQSLLVVTVY